MLKNKTNLLRIYFALFYMGIGIFTTYVTVFFKSQGLSDSQIGIITGLGPVMSLFGLMLAGNAADRLGKLNLVLSASFLLSALCALVFPVSKTFLYLLCINTVYTFATSPLLQLSDAMAVDYCAKHKKPFNTVKLCGTVGYAFIVLTSGYILENREQLMFLMIAGIFFVSALLVALVPDERVIKREKKNHAYGELFKDKALIVLYIANLLVFIPVSYYGSFFPIFIKALAGDSLSAVAWSSFLSLISEFPFLIFAHVLCKKFGNKKVLMTSCVLMMVRWVAIAVSSHMLSAVLFNMLKGASDIVFTYCTTAILNKRLADHLKGTGQAVLGILTYSVARIIGNYAGGFLSDAFGIRTVFLGCAVFPLIALFLLLSFSENKKTKKA
ncbi:MAG: MFS transporter [Clostridia bacterium]|nr:MFS transporter [Clostridia bacterium]